MPFSLTHRRSKKSLPKIKAPMRRARLAHDSTVMTEIKPHAILKKVSINLDGLASTLLKDGSWCVDHESKAESRQLLVQTQVNEKLTKENELLTRRNEILIDLAKTKIEEIDNMEKELRKFRRIVKKCAPKSANNKE